MTSESRRNESLRQIVAERRAAIVPGAADALTARIIAELEFEAVYVTGAGLANSYLGVPDLGLVTMTEVAQHVAAIRSAVSLPLIVDADTGFGGPLNVRRTVELFELAGANAIQLEDQTFPKRCGHFEGTAVVTADEMIQRIRAAVDARRDPNLTIIARTDARTSFGLEEALARAAIYQDAGADMTFVEAPHSGGELLRVATTLQCPQVANMVVGGSTPLVGQADLQGMGFALVLYANVALQAAALAVGQVLRGLREDGEIVKVDAVLSFEERQRLLGKPYFDELEARYSHQ